MLTPEHIAKLLVHPGFGMGNRLAKHLAPPLLEDLEQAIAEAIHRDRRTIRTALLNVASEVYPD